MTTLFLVCLGFDALGIFLAILNGFAGGAIAFLAAGIGFSIYASTGLISDNDAELIGRALLQILARIFGFLSYAAAIFSLLPIGM